MCRGGRGDMSQRLLLHLYEVFIINELQNR